MEKELQKIYKQTKEELEEKWSGYMTRQGAKIEALQKEYDELKRTGTPAEIKEKGKELGIKKRNMTLQDAHYKAMVEDTTARLAHTNEIAIAYINGEMPDIYTINYNDAYKGLVDGIKGISYELVDESTVSYLVKNKKLQLPKKRVNIPKDMRWNAKQINSAILQGILQGESIDKMADRILPIVDNNQTASYRTARTLTTQCENKGRIDRMENLSEQGLKMQKTWVATNDERTRESHALMDGETVDIDEPFSNDLMYPADPDGDPSEVYNCRCTMVTEIVGIEDADIVEENDDVDIPVVEEEPQDEKGYTEVNNREEAMQNLGDLFEDINSNLKSIDESLLVENTNRLNELNARFGALSKNNRGEITSTPSKNAIGYAEGRYARDIEDVTLGLSKKYYKDISTIEDAFYKARESKWNMDASDEFARTYVITHEYGHILENKIMRMRQKWGSNIGEGFVNDPRKEKKARSKEIRQEIIKIAKNNNSNFDLDKNISTYGKSNDFEFFAEVFANSQCGRPNELGEAMNQWLKKEGF